MRFRSTCISQRKKNNVVYIVPVMIIDAVVVVAKLFKVVGAVVVVENGVRVGVVVLLEPVGGVGGADVAVIAVRVDFEESLIIH
jgi:hypothetical protein